MFKYLSYLGITFLFSLKTLFAFSDNFDCEVINFSTVFELTNSKLIISESIILQINNRTGEKYTNIKIPYTKLEKISELEGRIEDASGTIVRKLKNSDITDKSDISESSLYEDDFKKTFSLKYNNYPYRVIYSYKITSRQFISMEWDPVLFQSVPTLQASLKLIFPKGCPIQKYEGNISGPEIDSVGNNIQYIWHANYPKPVKDEIYEVSVNKIIPHVFISPLKFMYGLEGSTKDWKSFGQWQYQLMKDLGELPENEEETVHQLIKGVKDKKEIIKILYHYMQDHTRYINVKINVGGLKPYPASYVAQNKYGDCKALSNYMKALLNVAGIKSYYTSIFRDDNLPEVIDLLPGPQYFNHVILTVPIDNDTIWLENTSNTNPFGYLSPDIQNREALLIDDSASHLIKIPALKNYDVLTYRKISITFNKAGLAEAVINISSKGSGFEYYNALGTELNKTEQDEEIRKLVNLGNYDLIQWELQRPNRDTTKTNLLLKLTLYKYLKELGQESYFNMIPINIPDFKPVKERMLPLEFSTPIFRIDTTIYNLPAGFELKTIPASQKVASVYGHYEINCKQTDNSVEVIRKFELYAGEIDLDKYSEFYAFIQSMKKLENMIFICKQNVTTQPQ